MTLSLQLTYWLIMCVSGWLFEMVLSYRTYGRLQGFRALKQDQLLLDGTFHVFVFEMLGLAGWSVYLAIGLAALFNTPPTTAPVGQTLIGQLIEGGLLTGITILWAQTVYSLMIGIREERRMKVLKGQQAR